MPLDECSWAAARCHLSPNEARTSGISAVNDPLTAEQIQLSPGFLNRHQVYYMRKGGGGRDRAEKERLMGEAVSQRDEGCSQR